MSNRTLGLDDQLYEYLRSVSLREHPALRELRMQTATHPHVNMQIAPEQGQFMQLLLRLLSARRIVEVGVFTGYSSLAAALVLPDDGYILACDISEEYTGIARSHWRAAGVEQKIDLRIAPALQTLDAELQGGAGGSFDFAFIDADKENTLNYYERVLQLLRPGGLVAIDNTLWSGRVADEHDQSADTNAIREVNRSLLADERVDMSLVPIGDGLTLARKR